MQETLLGLEVAVVGVVEGVRGRHVQIGQVAVAGAGRLGAVGLERRREAGVDVGLVVESVPEVLALRLPDGVSAREGDHVGHGEAFVAEGLGEVNEVEEWGR
mgnify:CR=1 FL=1